MPSKTFEAVNYLEKKIQYLNEKCYEFQLENRNLTFMIEKLEDKIKELQYENYDLYEKIENMKNNEVEEKEIDMDRIRMIMEKAKRMKKKNA